MKKMLFLLFFILYLSFASAEYFQTDVKVKFFNNTLNITTENPSASIYRVVDNSTSFDETIPLSIFRIVNINTSEEYLRMLITNATDKLTNITSLYSVIIAAQEQRDAYNRIIGQKDELNERSKAQNNALANITFWAQSQVNYETCNREKESRFTQEQLDAAKIEAEKKGGDGKIGFAYALVALAIGYGLCYAQYVKPKKVNQPGTDEFSELERNEDLFMR